MSREASLLILTCLLPLFDNMLCRVQKTLIDIYMASLQFLFFSDQCLLHAHFGQKCGTWAGLPDRMKTLPFGLISKFQS